MESKSIDWREVLKHEDSLDPKDWDSSLELSRKMISDMVHYLQNIKEEPVWRKPTDIIKQFLKSPIPAEGREVIDIYDDFVKHVLPFPKGNIHPRFWSWVQGTGTVTAMQADMLASAMNSNLAIGDHAAMYVEQQVIEWCKEMLGFDPAASGILLSGGSMANITALMVARNSHSPEIRTKGIYALNGRLVFYASSETHSCQQKAAEALGLGSEGLRKVPVDADYRMDIISLRKMIVEDLKEGLLPFCVVGNAGTVNTGATDPLSEIQSICKEYGLWFHIDGAFGALAKLLPEYADELKALESADSVAFDLHKWMYMPYEIGCLLIKDKVKHRAAFALQPSYLFSHERGLAAGPDPIGNYGMELSRGFKALKFWFCLQEHGLNKFRSLIRQNIAHCLYLKYLIESEPLLELLAPVPLNIVCFRFKLSKSDLDLNRLNKEILMQLHEQAIATPSYTLLNNVYAIRVAHVNHRSTKKDFEILVRETIRIGNELTKSVVN